MTRLTDNRFYTYTAIALDDMEVLFTELGANDSEFNLRREQALIFCAEETDAHSFISVLEPHGEYNGAEEFTVNSRGTIDEIEHHRDGQADVLRFRTCGTAVRSSISLRRPDATAVAPEPWPMPRQRVP